MKTLSSKRSFLFDIIYEKNVQFFVPQFHAFHGLHMMRKKKKEIKKQYFQPAFPFIGLEKVTTR